MLILYTIIILSTITLLRVETLSCDVCVIGSGAGGMISAARILMRSNGTAKTCMFSPGPEVDDVGGLSIDLNDLKPGNSALTKYVFSWNYDLTSLIDDDYLNFGVLLEPYWQWYEDKIEFIPYDRVSSHVYSSRNENTGEYTTIPLLQGMSIILLPTESRRSTNINEICLDYNTIINSGETHINADLVFDGTCTKDIKFNIDTISEVEGLLPDFRDRIDKKFRISINKDGSNKRRSVEELKMIEKEEGYIPIPIFNYELQLMSMFPEAINNIMQYHMILLLNLLGDPNAPILTLTQIVNWLFPLSPDHPNNKLIQEILSFPALGPLEYPESFPFRMGKGIDFAFWLFYTNMYGIKGGSGFLKDFWLSKIKDYGGLIKHNHPIISFLEDKQKSTPEKKIFSGVRARICPLGLIDDGVLCREVDYECGHIISSAGYYQDHRVLIPREIQEELNYDDIHTKVIGTHPLFYGWFGIEKSCTDLGIPLRAYWVGETDMYPNRLHEYVNYPAEVAKHLDMPYLFITTSDRTGFNQKYPDVCWLRMAGMVNTKLWDPWYGQNPKLIEDAEYYNINKKFSQQFRTTLCKLFPDLDCSMDIIKTVFYNPVDLEYLTQKGFDSKGNHMGCCGVSKYEWEGSLYTDEQIYGTNIWQSGNDIKWGCGWDIVQSSGNLQSYNVCNEESKSEYPTFMCNDDPKYPDCSDCTY